MVGTVVVVKPLMKLNRTLMIKVLLVGITLFTHIVKAFYGTRSRTVKDLGRYKITITAILDAGKSSGITILTVIDSLKDKKVSPEEMLELAETLTVNKKSLDKAFTTLIKDLKDHAIEKTGENNLND